MEKLKAVQIKMEGFTIQYTYNNTKEDFSLKEVTLFPDDTSPKLKTKKIEELKV